MNEVIAHKSPAGLGTGARVRLLLVWGPDLLRRQLPAALLVVASRWRGIVHRRTGKIDSWAFLTAWVLAVLMVMSSLPPRRPLHHADHPAVSLIAASLVGDTPASGFLSRTKRRFLGICNGQPLLLVLAVSGFCVFACLCRREWCTSGLAGVGLLAPLLVVSWKLDRDWKGLVRGTYSAWPSASRRGSS
jgi:hypothetical protein